MNPPMLTLARVASWLLVGLAVLVGSVSTGWVGASFPGFFLLPNRVVASAGLPGWAGAEDGRPVYQRVLVAVDSEPIRSAAEAYPHVGRQSPGQSVVFDFVHGGGSERRVFTLREFGPSDYLAIFGAYLLSGLSYLALAFVARRRWSDDPCYVAMTAVGCAGATFCLTAVDLYGPGMFFRLHAVGETLLLAALTHLAIACPARPRWGRELVPLLYAVAGLLALVSQVFLFEPRAYVVVHNLCQGIMIVPILTLAVRLTLASARTTNEHDARRLQWHMGGVLIGLVAPALIFGLSSLTGGAVPVSVAGWPNFFYPVLVIVSMRERRAALVPTPAVG